MAASGPSKPKWEQKTVDGGFQHDVFVATIHHARVRQHGLRGVDPGSLFGNVVLDKVKLTDRLVKLVLALGPL